MGTVGKTVGSTFEQVPSVGLRDIMFGDGARGFSDRCSGISDLVTVASVNMGDTARKGCELAAATITGAVCSTIPNIIASQLQGLPSDAIDLSALETLGEDAIFCSAQAKIASATVGVAWAARGLSKPTFRQYTEAHDRLSQRSLLQAIKRGDSRVVILDPTGKVKNSLSMLRVQGYISKEDHRLLGNCVTTSETYSEMDLKLHYSTRLSNNAESWIPLSDEDIEYFEDIEKKLNFDMDGYESDESSEASETDVTLSPSELEIDQAEAEALKLDLARPLALGQGLDRPSIAPLVSEDSKVCRGIDRDYALRRIVPASYLQEGFLITSNLREEALSHPFVPILGAHGFECIGDNEDSSSEASISLQEGTPEFTDSVSDNESFASASEGSSISIENGNNGLAKKKKTKLRSTSVMMLRKHAAATGYGISRYKTRGAKERRRKGPNEKAKTHHNNK